MFNEGVLCVQLNICTFKAFMTDRTQIICKSRVQLSLERAGAPFEEWFSLVHSSKNVTLCEEWALILSPELSLSFLPQFCRNLCALYVFSFLSNRQTFVLISCIEVCLTTVVRRLHFDGFHVFHDRCDTRPFWGSHTIVLRCTRHRDGVFSISPSLWLYC